MTLRTLIRRSLRHHWRSHLGVVLGAAIGSAALIGALAVGDSVRESLRARAMLRLGIIHGALDAHDRFFSVELAKHFNAVVLQLPAIALRADGTARANQVQVLGVDGRFEALR